MITHCNADQLTDLIKKHVIVIIDFTATWCGPCRSQGTILEKFEKDHPDVVIAKIDIDENRDLSAKMGIQCVPTLMFFLNGNHVTLKDKNRLIEKIEGVCSDKYLNKIVKGLKTTTD